MGLRKVPLTENGGAFRTGPYVKKRGFGAKNNQ